MAGILFIVNVPKKEYENKLRLNNLPNLIFEKEKIDKSSKALNEFDLKHSGPRTIESYGHDEDIVIKCRSTDCLHQHRNSELNKCNSETTLADGLGSDHKSYMRASWEEIKQVIKPKNKLKISRPVRGVDILGAFRCDTPLETILSEIVSRLDVKNAAWNSTKDDNFWQVIFSLESGNLSEELVQVLRTFGIGSRYQSSVSLLPCALYYKSNDRLPPATEPQYADESGSNTAWSRFSSSVRARTNLAQVLHDVKANGALTFDWVFMLLVAAFVAAIGLIENSTVILVASMLISPLMGPITAGTLGTAVRDRSLQLMGVKNEFLGLFLSLVVGFLVGLTICALDERYGVIEDWPTDEMLARCAHRSLWIGILVAIPSGAGCALAVLGDYTASLVGVAISASLLPPAVNAGLLWAMSLTRLVLKSPEQRWLITQPSELALMGTASLCLTLVNIVCIFLSGVTVYKVKEVSPLDRRDISWWKANRSRFNATKQNKENPLDWEAYTKWCTESLERRAKEGDVEKASDTSSVPSVHGETIAFRKRPSIIKRLRAQNIEDYCHKISLEDNYIPLNLQVNSDLDKQIEAINKARTPKINNERQHRRNTSQNTDSLPHGYYNMAYENDNLTKHRPTLEPSLSYTVDNKKYVNNKTFDV
ncbi:uncharacterized protein LOC142978459 [Anticarsia gemmatalis]|uniref:uncharacterized protein LOC142978459 n=1 Tax=Anticarsia gemmatalis TaxID=129554 RepID=UPI003F76CFFE